MPCSPAVPVLDKYATEIRACTTKGHIQGFFSGFIRNSLKLVAKEMSINSRMVNKFWYIHAMVYSYTAMKRKDPLIPASKG